MSTPYSDYAQRHLYRRHSMGNGYSVDPGIIIIPLAIPEPTDPEELKTFVPFVAAQAYCPTIFRNVASDTTKEGGPPKIMKPGSVGAFTFLGGDLFFHGPRIASNGYSWTWQVEGDYSFAVASAVSVELQNGFTLGSLPFPTVIQQSLTAGSQGTLPQAGSVLSCGADAKAAYAEGQSISFSADYYNFKGTSYYPAQFLDDSMLIGQTVSPEIA